MTNPTSNYGWVLPNSADLVTDLPADFDVALQGVDTRLKALQPGTTLGDLAYSSATANTNTRLAIGSSGQVLAVSGGVPAWTTPGGGAVVQVKSFYNTTTTTQTTAGSFIDTNLTLNITPTSASNKILVISTFSLSGTSAPNNTYDQGAAARVVRGSTALAESSTYFYVDGNALQYVSGVSSALTYLDSPATTSSTTYKMQMKKNAGNGGSSSGSFTGQSITLIEVTP